MGESKIGGVFRAKGVLSAEVQKVVRLHCERGNAQEMIEKVADYLVANGIVTGKIPPNAGVKSRDLLERTEHAMISEAEQYHLKGGVLTAKGYVSITGLVAEMAKQWIRSFAAPIPTEYNIKGTLKDPEIQDRLTIVSIKLQELLKEKGVLSGGMTDETCDQLILKTDDLEGICRRAAVEMFRAFNEPNEANHEIIHGETA
jgi:hypothetical protein